ncbi:hypothetical protein [Runella sp.]|jgi:hypothetical protein|uniref:hypothetical protein n=1 Tax=Runella sp. TaxID=1960881 RepID=UPI00260306D4|nr:hypothetical protein [Runella sp.]
MFTSAQSNELRKALLSLLFIFVFQKTFCQKPDTTHTPLTFNGTINVTNNGFSNIPSFSLGKPATIINLTVGGKRTSFEPELRFSLEGKPWSFLFWLRHKVIRRPKYQLSVGVHPGFNFRYEDAVIKGVESNYIVTRRYLTEELNQNFVVNKQVSMSLYYMYGRGIDVGTTKNTHYLSLRAAFSNLKITKDITGRLNPQVFYLKTDDKEGFFVAASLGIAKKNWPISIGAMMNQKIKSTIVTQDFNWNVGLNYVFGGKFKRY